MHVHFTETWSVLARSLRHLEGIPYDLLVSLPARNHGFAESVREDFPQAHVVAVPNRGRDVLPFIKIAGLLVKKRYRVVLKIHTKRSTHLAGGQAWLQLMLDRLLPTPSSLVIDTIEHVTSPRAGIAGPVDVYLPLSTYLEENRRRLALVLGGVVGPEEVQRVLDDPSGWGFFAGTMFWARLDAIEPLLRFHARDFEPEAGQVDGTFAHVLERAFSVLPVLQERDNYELSDVEIRSLVRDTPRALPSWFPEADRHGGPAT